MLLSVINTGIEVSASTAIVLECCQANVLDAAILSCRTKSNE
jgi:hypothetical protein